MAKSSGSGGILGEELLVKTQAIDDVVLEAGGPFEKVCF
jgi:hypothetical protein